MAAPMASPSMMKNPYLSHRTFLGSCELIARRTSLASPLPSFHAAFPTVLPAAGATLAPTFAPPLAPALAALLLLRAIHYLHLREVGFSKQRDTRKSPFGNSKGIAAMASFEARGGLLVGAVREPPEYGPRHQASRGPSEIYPSRRSLGARVCF